MTQSATTDLDKLRAIRDSVAEKGVLRHITFADFFRRTRQLLKAKGLSSVKSSSDLYYSTWDDPIDTCGQTALFCTEDEREQLSRHVDKGSEAEQILCEIGSMLLKDCIHQCVGVFLAMSISTLWHDFKSWIVQAGKELEKSDWSDPQGTVDQIERKTKNFRELLEDWDAIYADQVGVAACELVITMRDQW